MSYTVTKSDGTLLATIQDGMLDNTTALALPGPNYVGYGDKLNENLVHLLENFSGNTVPAGVALQGQLYFDKFNQVLKVFTNQGYVPVSGVTNAGRQPDVSKDGDLWFNTGTNQLSIWDNGQFKLVGPNYTKSQGVSGAIPVTVNDAGSSGVPHNILKLQYGGIIFATLSPDASFTPAGFDPGFPRINPGITINSNIASPLLNTNIVGNLTGGVTGNVVGNVTGNVVGNTTGIHTGTVVGNVTGNVVGTLTGDVVSTTVQTTNLISDSVQIANGSANLTNLIATTGQATNFSTGNALITGGVASLTNLNATLARVTNFSTANAVITGGYITGVANVTTAQTNTTNLTATTAQATNFSTGNAQITGGVLTGIATVTATTTQTTNFSTGNALITGGNINVTSVVGDTATLNSITVSNIRIAGGSMTGVAGLNNTLTSASLQSSTANTPNVSVKSTAIATTAYVHNVLPIGAIIMYSGTTVPYGWAICDGTANSPGPDLRGQFIVGAGGNYAVGDKGGSDTAQLSINNLPAHVHGLSAGTATSAVAGAHNHTATSTSTVTDPGHTHSIPNSPRAVSANPSAADGDLDGSTRVTGYDRSSVDLSIASATTGISVNTTTSLASADNHTHSITLSGNTTTVGSGTQIDIRPKYYALYYIQKVI
jgi:microcystin-dependent protein